MLNVNTDTINIEQLKDFITQCLGEKKAENIVLLDLGEKNQLAKYMIVASGRSIKNIGAIAGYIALELKTKYGISTTIEGLGNSEWVLLDAGDIIVHIFYPEMRSHLRLEEKWSK